jgi:DNA modification methylase
LSVSLLATDPPYGVSYVAKARDLHARGYGHSHAARDLDIDSDELQGQALIDFLKASLGTALDYLADKCALYVWHQDARRREFMAALDELQIFIHQIVIWLKPGFVIGRCNYHHRFEPAFHGWPKGKRPDFLGERNQSNVWDIGRENDKVHPTQKPIELFEKPILNHTVKGDIVYDPFAGSGTQFIAAERTGRKCYGIEIEPKYVNVILSRWEAETGKTAQLIDRVIP